MWGNGIKWVGIKVVLLYNKVSPILLEIIDDGENIIGHKNAKLGKNGFQKWFETNGKYIFPPLK